MRQSESFNGQVVRLLAALAILATLAATFFAYQRVSSTAVARAQTRHQQRGTRSKRNTGTQARATTNPSSSSFKNENHSSKLKLPCSKCHIPLTKPPDVAVVTAATKSVTKEYPYHDSCLDCHRVKPPQFFRGTTPVICVVCHTRSSPRLTRHDMNPFPKQSEQMILGDLSLMFNHESTSHRRECTTCHVNIAQLDIAKADVPISTCATSECHRKPGTQRNFDQEMLLLEDADIAGGKNRHPCTGCHSASIGGTPPPCSHYKLFGITNFNDTDFPKSAKLISEQCK